MIINSKRELLEWLNYEKKKYNQNIYCLTVLKSFLGSEKAVIYNFQRRLRLTEYYFNTGKKTLYLYSKVLLTRKSNRHGIHIGINVFDKGLKIMHLGPILVNEKAKAGKDVSIHINTAIVAHGVNGGVPIIGDGVVIGVGAVVLGNINIADGIAIGANALVNKSFTEKNIAIAGVPAKKISNNGRICWKDGAKIKNEK